MAIAASSHYPVQHGWDRNFFLVYLVLIWLGIGMGFGPEIAARVRTDVAPYPLIVHFHAIAFVGWLVLLSVQVVLIRTRRVDLHRRLGAVGVVLALIMIVLGPLTALTMDALHFGTPASDPAFLSVQFSDILAFAGLVAGAVVWRREAAVHKRLILLATIYISDAGFARWLASTLIATLGTGFGALLIALYLVPDLLVIGLGAYDYATRRRLHPAYVAGVAWIAANQLTAVALYKAPAWAAFTARLLGH